MTFLRLGFFAVIVNGGLLLGQQSEVFAPPPIGLFEQPEKNILWTITGGVQYYFADSSGLDFKLLATSPFLAVGTHNSTVVIYPYRRSRTAPMRVIDGAWSGPSSVRLSTNSKTAALFYRDRRAVLIADVVDESPHVTTSVAVPDSTEEILSVADSGVLLTRTSSTIQVIWNGAVLTVNGAEAQSPAVLIPGEPLRVMYVSTGSLVTAAVTGLYELTPTRTQIRVPLELEKLNALTVASAQGLIIASGVNGVLVIPLDGGSSGQVLHCDCEPKGLASLADGVMALGSDQYNILWLLSLAGPRGPEILFTPLRTNEEQGPANLSPAGIGRMNEEHASTNLSATPRAAPAACPATVSNAYSLNGLPKEIKLDHNRLQELWLVRAEPTSAAVSGVLSLRFDPDASSLVRRSDPVVFRNKSSSVPFTFPAGSTQAIFQIDSGRERIAITQVVPLSGRLIVAAIIDSEIRECQVAAFPAATPVLQAEDFRNDSLGIVSISLRGVSNTRDLDQTTYTFVLSKPPFLAVLTNDIGAVANSFFDSSPDGGIFYLTQQFSIDGSAQAIRSIGVVVSNSTGASAPVVTLPSFQ